MSKKQILFFTFIFIVFPIYSWANNYREKPDTIKTYILDEVVITSTSTSLKETNKIQSLPGSISILTPRVLEQNKITSIVDLSNVVPNLYIPDYGSKMTSAIYMRGVGARSSGQTVGIYVDGISLLNKSGFNFEFSDVRCIEVLRGPQGTLYGRNAMSGIVFIETRSGLDLQGTELRFSGGNYDAYKASINHRFKLSDKVGFSLNGFYNHLGGYFENHYDGRKADWLNESGGKVRLDWKPNRTTSIMFSSDYNRVRQGAFPYGLYNPTLDKVSPINYNEEGGYKRDMVSNRLNILKQFEHFSFTSLTGYQYLSDKMNMDQDYSPEDIFTLSQNQKEYNITQELVLKNKDNRPYKWMLGAFGFYQHNSMDAFVEFRPGGIRKIIGTQFEKLNQDGVMPVKLFVDDSKTVLVPSFFKQPKYGFALYHQSTIEDLFLPGLSLTGGIRLDYEYQKIDYNSSAAFRFGVQISGFEKKTWLDTPSVLKGVADQKIWQVLPRMTIKYKCTPTITTYFSIAKGYKAGGYNEQIFADLIQEQQKMDMMNRMLKLPLKTIERVADLLSYDPEISYNYELGFHSAFLKDRFSIDASLFLMDVRDVQITRFVASGAGRMLLNAGKSQNKGFEMSFRSRLTDHLTVDLNYGYTHAKFTDYATNRKVGKELEEVNYKGNYVPYIPRYTFSTVFSYHRFLDASRFFFDHFQATLSIQRFGTSYWTIENNHKQKGYDLLNSKITVGKGITEFSFWMRNITNKDYALFYFESLGNPFMQKGKPMTFGFDLTLKF